jgi:hypothetical protein
VAIHKPLIYVFFGLPRFCHCEAVGRGNLNDITNLCRPSLRASLAIDFRPRAAPQGAGLGLAYT